MTDFAAARLNMVESQIRPNKVTDPGLVAAFEAVAREAFVGEARRRIAYVDEALQVAPGRHLRSEEHPSEVQTLMRSSYAVICSQQNIKLRKSSRSTIKRNL